MCRNTMKCVKYVKYGEIRGRNTRKGRKCVCNRRWWCSLTIPRLPVSPWQANRLKQNKHQTMSFIQIVFLAQTKSTNMFSTMILQGSQGGGGVLNFGQYFRASLKHSFFHNMTMMMNVMTMKRSDEFSCELQSCL